MNKDLIQELAHKAVTAKDISYLNSSGRSVVVDKELQVDLVKFADLIEEACKSPKIKPLVWTEYEPSEECRYNHSIAETPFGRILITWKGWKEFDTRMIEEFCGSVGPLDAYVSLLEAQNEAELRYCETIMKAFL